MMTSLVAVGGESGPRIVSPAGGIHPRADSDETHRILAVDDDETVLDLIVSALSGLRYEVDVARTCKDALPLILFRDYCSVILDLILPDANGLSLFRHIARRRPGMRSRVIFVTGAMERDEARRFVKLIDTRLLLKPFRLDDLIAAVQQVDSRVLR